MSEIDDLTQPGRDAEDRKPNHPKRVCAFSMAIAKAMGLPLEQVARNERSGFHGLDSYGMTAFTAGVPVLSWPEVSTAVAK